MILKRLYNLLSIKSIITLLFSVVLCICVFKGIENETLKNIVVSVIGYYFGTQKIKE